MNSHSQTLSGQPTLQHNHARYNVLDELTLSESLNSSGAQTRIFTYDNLGRLWTAKTPEGGTTCFGTVSGTTCQANSGYDNYDNLKYRTDARGVLSSYSYDGLNRLTGVSYNVGTTGVPATASVGLTYGASGCTSSHGAGCIGQLITLTDGVGSENYSYNSLEQPTQLQKIISGTTYTTNYLYNVAGELTQITYPSGRVVQQSVDAIGRLCEIAPSTTGCGTASSPYATGYLYNSASQVTGFKYGNGIFASLGFSANRLQLNCLDYSTTNRSGSCTHDATTKFGLTYTYGTGTTNNGQILGITDNVDNGRTVAYSYDPLSRLATALTTGSTAYPQWGLSWNYDGFGNRTAQNLTAGSGYSGSVSVNASTNRITTSPYAYDANGNMTNDATNTLVYDAENRATSATNSSSSGAYTYDGNGLRVKKVSGATTTVYIFSGSKVIAEYDNGAAVGSPSREYIYGGAALLAKVAGSTTTYYHQDHLSNRLVTSSTGSTVAQMGHYPFGDPWYNATNDKLYFTTYERDAESGNDYAMARYYVWRIGRFLSVDPLSGSTGDPQSLNRYDYVENDPINLKDPSGACPQWGPFLGFCTVAGTHQIDPYALLTNLFNMDLFDLSFEITGYRGPNDTECPNGDCAPGTRIPIFGNLDIFLELLEDDDSGGGGGPAGPKLHLQVESDCIGSIGRDITYRLFDDNNKPVPSMYVTEHQTDKTVANGPAGPGTSTDPAPPYPAKTPFASGFGDTLGGLGFHNSLQTFTVSPDPPGAGGPNYSVFVRDLNGNDYGTLGTWIQNGQVFINGKLATKLCN